MRVLLVILLLFSSGCSLRVFQAKVPSALHKTESHQESEKVASDYLARNIVDSDQRQVAVALSQSLGLPKDSNQDPQEITSDLKSEIQTFQANQTSLNDTLAKYEGKKIEDTGWNIGKNLSWTSIVVLIVLLIACPSLITILFYLLRQSRSAIKAIVQGIEDFKFTSPQSANTLKQILSANMDAKHKDIIHKVKS